MKEQAQLREEMAYQYKIGNFEVRKLFPYDWIGIQDLLIFKQLNFVEFLSSGGCCYTEKIGPRCCHVDVAC